ncbi:hypothetical protein [Streptomyces sp. NPDC060184]|uniref:hypothetical protein n=1 Tax=Streptomyces sp. NPDC060184 TaxID=3347064 RepID=UPI003666C69D
MEDTVVKGWKRAAFALAGGVVAGLVGTAGTAQAASAYDVYIWDSLGHVSGGIMGFNPDGEILKVKNTSNDGLDFAVGWKDTVSGATGKCIAYGYTGEATCNLDFPEGRWIEFRGYSLKSGTYKQIGGVVSEKS